MTKRNNQLVQPMLFPPEIARLTLTYTCEKPDLVSSGFEIYAGADHDELVAMHAFARCGNGQPIRYVERTSYEAWTQLVQTMGGRHPNQMCEPHEPF